jgi:hypothetical protein
MPAHIAFYADGILLKRINGTQLPSDPMALWFYVMVSSGAPALNATALVKSVSYTLGACPWMSSCARVPALTLFTVRANPVGGSTAECPASHEDASGASDGRWAGAALCRLVWRTMMPLFRQLFWIQMPG